MNLACLDLRPLLRRLSLIPKVLLTILVGNFLGIKIVFGGQD